MHSKSITAYLIFILWPANSHIKMQPHISIIKVYLFYNENFNAEIAAVTVLINQLMHFLSKLEMSNIFLCLLIAKNILYRRLNLLILKTAALRWKLQWYKQNKR